MKGLVSTIDIRPHCGVQSLVFRASIGGVVYSFCIHVDLLYKSKRDLNFKFIMTGGL